MSLFSLTVQLEVHVLFALANESKEKMFVMDNTSLRKTIERILELKYRYIGSFPADCIPKLPTFSFAIINTSPSSEALNRPYYYAIFMAGPIQKKTNFVIKSNKK